MDAQRLPGGDVKEFEKRLSRLQPTPEGLNADAMLFAAGRASARSWRMWATAAGLLAVLALGLGCALLVERTERLTLAHQLAQRQGVVNATPNVSPPGQVDPASDDYLQLRNRVLHQGIEAWPTVPGNRTGPGLPPPAEPILQVWSPDRLIDQ
jgi:hypothetical protein